MLRQNASDDNDYVLRIALIEQEMQRAVAAMNFEDAARLRDEIKVAKMEQEMQRAVAAMNFEDAAKLRDAIKLLQINLQKDAPQDTSASHLAKDMVAGTSQPTPPGIAGDKAAEAAVCHAVGVAAAALSPTSPKGMHWGKVREDLTNIVQPHLLPAPTPIDTQHVAAATPPSPGSGKKNHVASLRNNSLSELLFEAFRIAEIRFQNFDLKDHPGGFAFDQLKRAIASDGFYDEMSLMKTWQTCDLDGSNFITFNEWLFLLYMWQYAFELKPRSLSVHYSPQHVMAAKIDLYSAFFSFRINRQIVCDAFSRMESLYRQYDSDGNRQFSFKELDLFMRDHLPEIYAAPKTKGIILQFYPANKPGTEIDFPNFLGLLYLCCCEMAPDRLRGAFKSQCFPGGTLDLMLSPTNLKEAFRSLEDDFSAFDLNGNGRVEVDEIIQKLNCLGKKQNVEFFSNLEWCMRFCDLEKSGSLDFWQFCLLAYHMNSTGFFSQLDINTQNGKKIKQSMTAMHCYFRKLDREGTFRFSREQFEALFKDLYQETPTQARMLFQQFKYKSTSVVGKEVVDMLRMMKILHAVVYPTGKYVCNRYQPPQLPASDPSKQVVTICQTAPEGVEDLIIDPVCPEKIVKGKLLGQGGQGVAYLATYDGVKLCAKFIMGQVTSKLLKDTLVEVGLMKRLKHPNCHHFIGANTSNAEIVILTELCGNGSLFDYYTKNLIPRHQRLDHRSAARLALECANGLDFLHSLNYMHRDLKSLNIFLDANMVAKLADFGMATSQPTSSEGCGTAQWMAPEVLRCVLGIACAYDRRSDVYSLGVVMWELFHCHIPYSSTGLDQMGICHNVLAGRIGLQCSPFVPKNVAHLVGCCMSVDARIRPTSAQLKVSMTRIASELGV